MEGAGRLQLGMLRQKRLAFGGITIKRKADFRVALQSLGCAWDGDLRAEIATHDIDGNSDHACFALILVSNGRRAAAAGVAPK